jgi:hypothetical protein
MIVWIDFLTGKLFALIIAVQVILFLRGVYKKERPVALFSLLSVFLIILISGIMEFKVHHYLRHSYSIPNTAVYLSVLLVISVFLWNFKEIIQRNYYSLLISGGSFWGLSAVIDLLTDAKIINIPYNDLIENILIAAGSILLLSFYISVLIKTYSYKKLHRLL